MKKVGIIGLGLMGGSLALRIKHYQRHVTLFGMSRTPKTRQYAADHNIVDHVCEGISDLPEDLDLVIVCTPIDLTIDIIKAVSKVVSRETIITDIASVKQPIEDEVTKLNIKQPFVGGHPIAGKEVAGIQHAESKIYDKSTYILTGEKSEALESVTNFLSSINVYVHHFSASDHDRFIGLTSHYPFLMALVTRAALVDLDKKDRKLVEPFIGPGFKDTTRVSQSDVEWVVSVCRCNREVLLQLIDQSIERLDTLKDFLKNRKYNDLKSFVINIQTEN